MTAHSTVPLLTVEHLTVRYRREGGDVRALNDITFALTRGETLAVVGESGSGKSTLALALMGLIAPREGEITAGTLMFNGQDLRHLSPGAYRSIRGKALSLIFQDPFNALNPLLTAGEQIMEALPPGTDAPFPSVMAALAAVQFPDPERIYRSYPHQLSGGQRQRVAIAAALINRPQLLLADEPTAALDVTTQKEVLDVLDARKHSLALSVLFITHHIALAATRADRIMVMKEGTIVEIGPAREIITAARDPYTRALIAAIPRLRTTAPS